MKKLSIQIMALCSVFGFASGVMAEDCKPAPDCADLGFTQNAADCSGDALKCPWDLTKAACKAGDESEDIKEDIKPVPCAVGSILGNDQLCYEDKLPDGVKPVGIVFDTDNKLAVALTNVNKDGSACDTWSLMLMSTAYSSTSEYNIPTLGNCTSSTDLTTCGADGRANTTAILNCGNICGTTPAATAANSYEPSGCSKDFCKKTKWFLPSMRDLRKLYRVKFYVNTSLTWMADFGAKTLYENGGGHWSSTQSETGYMWGVRMDTGEESPNYRNGASNAVVRPVVKY